MSPPPPASHEHFNHWGNAHIIINFAVGRYRL